MQPNSVREGERVGRGLEIMSQHCTHAVPEWHLVQRHVPLGHRSSRIYACKGSDSKQYLSEHLITSYSITCSLLTMPARYTSVVILDNEVKEELVWGGGGGGGGG